MAGFRVSAEEVDEAASIQPYAPTHTIGRWMMVGLISRESNRTRLALVASGVHG
jgi:hypothetical protein